MQLTTQLHVWLWHRRQRCGAGIGRWLDRQRMRRRARHEGAELSRLPDRLLRDIGLEGRVTRAADDFSHFRL